MTFVPLPKSRRKTTKPKTIVDNLCRLSDWYAVNRPGLRSMTISADDAYSLRQLWKKKDAKVDGKAELRSQGFCISDTGDITWSGFELVEQKNG